MKPLLTTLLCLLILGGSVLAQDSIQSDSPAPQPKQDIGQRIYYGGSIGLTFGSYTRIGVYPLVGYKITPKLSAGIKLGYEYIKDNRYATQYETSNYGASLFTRYRIIPQLYAHVEFAGLNYELYNPLGESQREWVPFLLVGGGYSQPVGPRTWLNVEVLFDVLQNEKSPYSAWTPIVSVGVGVGF